MPRDQQRRKGSYAASRASSRTQGIRGQTGMTKAQEEKASVLLRALAETQHGQEIGNLTDADRKALSRDVAVVMRRSSRTVALRQRITVEGVRKVAQRIRSEPDTRSTFPVDLDADAYDLTAQRRAETGQTMKAIASAAIRAVYGKGA